MKWSRILLAAAIVAWVVAAIRLAELRRGLQGAAAVAAAAPVLTHRTLRSGATLSLPDLLDAITSRALFSPDRTFEHAFEPASVEVVAEVREVKPHLVLRGLAGGPPWSALVEGIPEFPGQVILTQHDSVAGLIIARVKRDTVVIRGRDTTWTLTLDGPQ